MSSLFDVVSMLSNRRVPEGTAQPERPRAIPETAETRAREAKSQLGAGWDSLRNHGMEFGPRGEVLRLHALQNPEPAAVRAHLLQFGPWVSVHDGPALGGNASAPAVAPDGFGTGRSLPVRAQHLETLGLTPDAPLDVIRSTYRDLQATPGLKEGALKAYGQAYAALTRPEDLRTLGIKPGEACGPEDVKRRYRQIAWELRPDTSSDKAVAHRWAQVVEAYNSLRSLPPS